MIKVFSGLLTQPSRGEVLRENLCRTIIQQSILPLNEIQNTNVFLLLHLCINYG